MSAQPPSGPAPTASAPVHDHEEQPKFLNMIGLVALVVAIVILVFFAIGYLFGRLFL